MHRGSVSEGGLVRSSLVALVALLALKQMKGRSKFELATPFAATVAEGDRSGAAYAEVVSRF
jgi:hypothetical protein